MIYGGMSVLIGFLVGISGIELFSFGWWLALLAPHVFYAAGMAQT